MDLDVDPKVLHEPIPETARGNQQSAPKFYTLKTFELSEGRSSYTLAQSDLFRLSMKVYAEGGENMMHAHAYEDHAFTILKGQATFHVGSDEKVQVVNAHQGVFMPRGVLYRFESTGEENLVILRVGAEVDMINKELWRIKPDGTAATPDTPERRKANGYLPPVVVPGKFHFG